MRKEIFSKIRIVIISVLLLTALLFGTFQTVSAASPYNDGIFEVGEEEFDDLLIEGARVEVGGTVHGMLFAFGETVVVQKTAVIDDDAFLFGNQIIVEEGAVLSGNVYSAGQNVKIAADVARSLFVGAATLDLQDQAAVTNNLFFVGFQFLAAEGTSVGRNLYAGNYQSILNGTVENDGRIGAGAVRLNGVVNGDFELDVDSAGEVDPGFQYWATYMQQYGIPEPIEPGLQIADSAEVGGALIYTSPVELESLNESLIEGGVVYNTPQPETIVEAESQQMHITYRNPLLNRAGRVLRLLVTLALLGALVLWLKPQVLKDTAEQAAAKPLNAAGVGFISMVVVFIGATMLFGLLIFLSIMFSLIGLNGLGSAIFFFGLASLVWVVTMFSILMVYGSKLVVADWVGSLILGDAMAGSKYKPAVALLIGLAIYVFVTAIPILGGLIRFAVTLVGLGAMWFYYKRKTTKVLPAEAA